MNIPAVNSETIVKYLLGSLPEGETERLDELSITHDEFAVALSAAEKDLVDAYVQGELTGAALDRFRSHYLASSLRRNRLDFAHAFVTLTEHRLTAASPTAPNEYPSERPTKQERSGGFSGKGFTTLRLSWQWGFAVAAIVFLLAGIWLAFENMRLRQQVLQMQAPSEGPGKREQELQNDLERQREANTKTEQELARVREERERIDAQPKQRESQTRDATDELNAPGQPRPSPRGNSVASFILTPQMRGVQQIPTIAIPADMDRVTMTLELEPNDYSTYRVALIDQAGAQTFWRSRQLNARVTANGKSLSISFPASLLKPQVYALRVTGEAVNTGTEVVSDYPFKVVKQ